jgi:hypothetical protein
MEYTKHRMRLIGALAACALLGAGASASGAAQDRTVNPDHSLRAFLRGWAGKREDPDTRYTRAWVSLRDDGAQQVIVYIEGRSWCGSGGCSMLVLEPKGGAFRIVGYSTITRPPIRVLARVSNGWRDIGVRVAGGGINPGYDAGLPFDGKQYPLNPSVPPARNATGERVKATAITGKEAGQPLFEQ